MSDSSLVTWLCRWAGRVVGPTRSKSQVSWLGWSLLPNLNHGPTSIMMPFFTSFHFLLEPPLRTFNVLGDAVFWISAGMLNGWSLICKKDRFTEIVYSIELTASVEFNVLVCEAVNHDTKEWKWTLEALWEDIAVVWVLLVTMLSPAHRFFYTPSYASPSFKMVLIDIIIFVAVVAAWYTFSSNYMHFAVVVLDRHQMLF